MSADQATTNDQAIDSGLACLVLLARYHQVAVEPTQVEHRFGQPGKPLRTPDLLRAAKALGLKAKAIQSSADRLHATSLPTIACGVDGGYFIIAKTQRGDDGVERVLVQDPRSGRPEVLALDALVQRWSGEVILIARRASLADWRQRFDFSWFIPSLIKYRRLFGEVLIASFFLQLFALATPIFFQVVMDKVLVHQGFSTLDVLAVAFFIVVVFEALIGGLRNYLFAHTANRVDVELGAKLFDHLLHLPLAYFESRQVGQSVARVRELESLRQFLTGSALTLIIDLGFTLIFFGVMWWYSPALTVVVLLSLPLYVALSAFITPILRRRLDRKFEAGARNQSFLVESVSSAQTIKALAVEPQFQRRWEEQLADYVHTAFRAQNLGNIANQCAGLIQKLTTLGILWWGAHLVIGGNLTVGQLVAFNMLAGRVSGPILKLVQLWQDVQQAGISMQRLGDILNTPREPGFNPGRAALPSPKGEVRFEHVRFRYRPETAPVLDGLDLHVKAGEVVGIVGRSGSGKSTLTKLIQRLYVPEGGRVTVDGVDLALVDTAWLRRRVGVVLQENVLLNRSVRENIALIDPGLPMEGVIRAATLAGAHDFIVELPQGYDTVVEEHGSNLSGGQRQRIAIARALVHDPRILIFDEATSALDYESERIVQDNLVQMCQGRTVFIIAHRLSTVRHCDRILVMERGRVVEQGSHDELIATNGYYARLNGYQSAPPRSLKPIPSERRA